MFEKAKETTLLIFSNFGLHNLVSFTHNRHFVPQIAENFCIIFHFFRHPIRWSDIKWPGILQSSQNVSLPQFIKSFGVIKLARVSIYPINFNESDFQVGKFHGRKHAQKKDVHVCVLVSLYVHIFTAMSRCQAI